MTTTRNRSPRRQHAIHNQQCLTSTSTGIDTIRQDTAERNENSCAHARERSFQRHSHTQPRHSREGGNPRARARQRRSVSFPNRRAEQEPAANSPSTGINTIRQDAAERNENSCACARGVFPHVIPAPCLRHSHTHVIPTPTHVIPAKAGIPVPAAYWGPIALICRPRVRHKPTNRTHEETRLRFGTTRDTLIDSVRCRAPRRLANECRTAHPRTMLLKRPCD